MKKTIYFVRHGESEANVAEHHGSPTTPLTQKGIEQAKFIAERVSKLPIECVISSTMTRAQQTAQEIAQKIGKEVESSELFIEATGPTSTLNAPYTDPAAIEAFGLMRENYGKPGWRLEDAEVYEDHTTRAKTALEFLSSRPENNILVVSHGIFLRILTAHVIFWPQPTAHECQKMSHGLETQNTGLTVFHFGPKNFDGVQLSNPWRVYVWNDHAHLG
jgi:probable phosphoglycerate mutase